MAIRPVPITPEVLAWAMDSADLTDADLANRVESTTELVHAWRDGTAQPSTGQFRDIAKALGRPPSFFFLARPPRQDPVAVSFRSNLRESELADPSSDEPEAVRLALRLQRTAAWIAARVTSDAPAIPTATISDEPDAVAANLRDWLEWSFADQVSAEYSEAAITQLFRAKLQDRGIVVLHLSLSEHIVRGFSLPHESAPLIAINTKDAYTARLFSYAHELAHLALHDGSLCLTRENKGTERWCNRVAAALLMPAPEIEDYVRERFSGRIVDSLAEVRSLRSHFKVSSQAIAIRLELLGLGRKGLYDELAAQPVEKRRRGGRPNPDRPQDKPRVRLQQFGRGLVNSILDAEDAGVLPAMQVLDLLKVSRGELEKLRQYAETGAEG